MPNPTLNPVVLLSVVEDGYVAYDLTSDTLHHLNSVASVIAELCDGNRDMEELGKLVGPLLPDGKTAEIDRWVDEGLKAGLLISTNNQSAARAELSAGELSDLAERLREKGKNQTAYLCRKRATELDPSDPKAWKSLGDVAHIVGRRAQAREAFNKYLELQPGDAEVQHLVVALSDDAVPARAPDECIRQIYRDFSTYYESQMVDDLGYEGPARLHDAIRSAMGTPAGLNTLDLGCGSGLAGVSLRPLSSRMVGIDLSPEMIELARAREIYDQLAVAEITDWLDQTDEQFDIIAACDCLIYFGDLHQIVAAAAKRVSSDGALALSMERSDHYPFRLMDSGRYAHHPDHVREVASAAGLKLAHLDEAFLRTEYDNEVTGLFAILN